MKTLRRSAPFPLLACLVLAAAAEAQDPAPPPDPWQPADWDGETISLLDSVRVALDHAPGLRLEEEAVRGLEGALQEASGQFDLALLSDLTFEYTREALRASERREEEQNRQDLRDDIAATEQQLAFNTLIQEQLRALQADPTGARVSDPDIQGIIDLLNLQIASSSGDLRQSLIALRDQAIANALADVEEDRTDLLFDLENENTTLRNLGATPEERESYFGLFEARLSKPLRNGIIFGPFFSYTVSGNRYVDKPVDVLRGGLGVEDVYRGELGLDFAVPLGRGLGAVSTAAFERAARFSWEAGLFNVEHAAALTVLETALAYWDLVGAQQRVTVLRDLSGLQERLVDLTGALIEADEIPRAESARVGARQAEIQSGLQGAVLSEQAARIALADAMGLAVDSMEDAPAAGDPFPPLPDPAAVAALDVPALAAAALVRRGDQRSAELLVEANEALLRRARADLRPIVDLASRVWWTAVGEDDAEGAITNRWVGPSYNLALHVDWPFANNVQEGLFLQATARDQQQRIVTGDLARRVSSSVVELVATLRESLEQVRWADEAERQYATTLDNEVELYRAGISTLVSTLLTEQRLTEARLAGVAARQLSAQLLAQLRFATGTLVIGDGEGTATVAEEALVTLPATPVAAAEHEG